MALSWPEQRKLIRRVMVTWLRPVCAKGKFWDEHLTHPKYPEIMIRYFEWEGQQREIKELMKGRR